MSDPINKTFLITTVVGSVIAAAVWYYVNQKLTEGASKDGFSSQFGEGTQQPPTTGTIYANAGSNNALQPTPQQTTYQGPGSQANRSSFNGQIFVKRWHEGNHNFQANYEQSGSIQSATKNPFANGPNCYYARAVAKATQDPTNQVSSLVLGPGIAPDND